MLIYCKSWGGRPLNSIDSIFARDSTVYSMNTVQYVSFACYDRDRYKFIIFDIWISLKYRTDYTNSAHIMILQSAVYYVHSYISYYGRTRVLGICTCIHNYRRSNTCAGTSCLPSSCLRRRCPTPRCSMICLQAHLDRAQSRGFPWQVILYYH